MPTTRRRRGHVNREQLSEVMAHFLLTGERNIGLGGDPSSLFVKSEIRSAWANHKDALLRDWIHEHPGSRPWFWWEREAPRQPVSSEHKGFFWNGKLPNLRRKTKGSGIESWRILNYAPECNFGVPHLIELKRKFPPFFEAEASYLKRHKLLSAAEIKKLTKNDFAPVPYTKYFTIEEE